MADGVLLEDVCTVVRIGPVVLAVPRSHMLWHRKRRIRDKWEKRLRPAIRAAVVRVTMDAIRANVERYKAHEASEVPQ